MLQQHKLAGGLIFFHRFRKERKMVDRSGTVLCGLMIFALVSLTGCPPPSTSKPETSAPSPGETARAQAGAQSTVKEGSVSATPSSIDRLRQGETASSSPVKDVYFAFDSYDLRPDARETLKANADWLKAHPSVRVEIEGHCDERGTNQYNLALGAQRAQAAKDYLVTLGIARERLSTISYGEEVPVCREQTEECWQKNRRDRFVVIPERPAS
jgi:peptidoglycan-associated lipoprotein